MECQSHDALENVMTIDHLAYGKLGMTAVTCGMHRKFLKIMCNMILYDTCHVLHIMICNI